MCVALNGGHIIYSLDACVVFSTIGNGGRCFFGQCNGTVLECTVCLPEQIFAVILEALVQATHKENRHHR